MRGMRRVRHVAEYGALSVLFYIARLLPLSWTTAGSVGIWQAVGPRHRRHQRALDNMACALPHTTRHDREHIAREMWANMGRTTAEALFLERIAAQPDRFEVVGLDAFAMPMRQPGPRIGVTLHMGNWELAVWPCAVSGGNPAGVYRPIENPHVDRLLRRKRQFLYPGGLFAKCKRSHKDQSGQSTARRTINYVRSGGRLACVCDEVDRRGLPIPFFNHQARFTTVPAMIARHTGARLWLVRCQRIAKASRFRIEVREVNVPRTADKQLDILAATRAIIQQFEAWIRETPEQWLWSNTRWVDGDNKKRSKQTTIASDGRLVSPPGAVSTISSLQPQSLFHEVSFAKHALGSLQNRIFLRKNGNHFCAKCFNG